MMDCPLCGGHLDVTPHVFNHWTKAQDAFVLRAADLGFPCGLIKKLIGYKGETTSLALHIVKLRAARKIGH